VCGADRWHVVVTEASAASVHACPRFALEVLSRAAADLLSFDFGLVVAQRDYDLRLSIAELEFFACRVKEHATPAVHQRLDCQTCIDRIAAKPRFVAKHENVDLVRFGCREERVEPGAGF